MNKNFLISISIIMIAIFALTACNFPQETPEVDPSAQTQVAIFAQATLTKFAQQAEQDTPTETAEIPVESTSTQAPASTEAPGETTQTPEATTVPPTEEPSPEPTNVPQATPTSDLPQPPSGSERVNFAPGTTNTTVSGTVEANQSKRYVVWVEKSQLMEFATSADSLAYISIKTPSGKELVPFSNNWIWYRDYAQETGDYVVDVSGRGYKSNYNLVVNIPQIINFEQGKTSVVVKATVPGNHSHDFALWAAKSQQMTVSLSEPAKFVLSIRRFGGTELLKQEDKKNSFDGTLPEAGTYIITIHNITADPVNVDFNLSIK